MTLKPRREIAVPHEDVRKGTFVQAESAAGTVLARMPERSPDIRHLAFWLYTLCERKGWAGDAHNYNELVTAWHAVRAASQEAGEIHVQGSFDV